MKRWAIPIPIDYTEIAATAGFEIISHTVAPSLLKQALGVAHKKVVVELRPRELKSVSYPHPGMLEG